MLHRIQVVKTEYRPLGDHTGEGTEGALERADVRSRIISDIGRRAIARARRRPKDDMAVIGLAFLHFLQQYHRILQAAIGHQHLMQQSILLATHFRSLFHLEGLGRTNLSIHSKGARNRTSIGYRHHLVAILAGGSFRYWRRYCRGRSRCRRSRCRRNRCRRGRNCRRCCRHRGLPHRQFNAIQPAEKINLLQSSLGPLQPLKYIQLRSQCCRGGF